ncbi:MAG: hypothetical protein SGARI_001258 [Bacillariaceae sp.]
MNFSEKTFGFAWASYVAISSGTASLLMVYAPLLLVQRDNNDGFGGMGAAFGGGRPRPRPRRPAPQPAPAAAPPPPPPAEAVAQLTAMGFEEARVKEALQVSGNNVETAANILLTG